MLLGRGCKGEASPFSRSVEDSRIVGYDNERPKGDHRHVDGVEEPYCFTGPEDLIKAFLAEVTRRRSP
ncbi:toxin-antitoxin system TumE family protein [Trinickia sp.]|uniref:toxin-antitoxin system TumE family protein n=1 Tax=Trinickia sp. TaxID=2571163 RepID=UPI003F7D1FF3